MIDCYVFGSQIEASVDIRFNNQSIKNIWNGYCLKASEISFNNGNENTFVVGTPEIPVLPDNKEYVLSIGENGIAVVGADYGGLVRGFMSLIGKIEYQPQLDEDNSFYIKYGYEESNYNIKKRMIHVCVFPENDLYFIKKIIRLSAVCQYTHIVLEFWGTLKFDCLSELSWPGAFTKEQIGDIINEIRELGMEPIPMFNQLGHATSSRERSGKHVVLEQNPLLQNLFTPDGWAWNINSVEVKNLLKKIRHELYELFGEGEYIHIGCDEAYFYSMSDEARKGMPAYLNELMNEVEKENRKPMLWMDMFLANGEFKNCFGTAKPEEVQALMNSLTANAVLVDWQYGISESPIPTLEFLNQYGFELIGAPWYDEKNVDAHINTITKNNISGIMFTTWHTLKDCTFTIVSCAKKMNAKVFSWQNCSNNRVITATVLRRVSYDGNSYEQSGWMKNQIDI